MHVPVNELNVILKFLDGFHHGFLPFNGYHIGGHQVFIHVSGLNDSVCKRVQGPFIAQRRIEIGELQAGFIDIKMTEKTP